MAEYLDLGINIQYMVDALHYSSEEQSDGHPQHGVSSRRRHPIDPSAFLRVRPAVCVAGYQRNAVMDVKNKMGKLLSEPFAIEGFHVKTASDVKDGAFLVPKVVLVATHCPGRKLLDDEGDQGQLDDLYDEAVDMRANLMLIYLGLPRSIYQPMRHIVYHPKMADMVFPSQPLLRDLAAENCLITVTEGSDLNNMQKNVLREWITKEVGTGHPIYKTADYLSSVEMSLSEAEWEHGYVSKKTYYCPPMDSSVHDPLGPDFRPATEEHPLADKRKKKRRKEKSPRKDKRGKTSASPFGNRDLGTLEELVDLDNTDVGLELNTMNRREYGVDNSTYDNFV